MAMDAKAAQAYLIGQGITKVSEQEAGKLLEKLKAYFAVGSLSDEELYQVAGGATEPAELRDWC